jgi:enoyl-CoA hydratase/carnithine racemase
MSTDYTEVLSEARDGIAWITLNRAEKANAMTLQMMQTAAQAIDAAGRNESIKAIVLTAAGEKIFSAGVDVRTPAPDGDEAAHREHRSAAGAALQDAVLDCPKPVVAALNGAAIGGGAMLALLADACVAVPASLSLPEVDIGIPTYSGANIVEVIGGRTLAADLVLSGRRMPAQDAVARGVYRSVVAPGELRAAAAEIALALGAKPAGTYADIKRWVNRKLKAAIEEARLEHARHRAHAKH